MDFKKYYEDVEDVSAEVLLLTNMVNYFKDVFSEFHHSENYEESETLYNLLYIINFYAEHVSDEVRNMLQKHYM